MTNTLENALKRNVNNPEMQQAIRQAVSNGTPVEHFAAFPVGLSADEMFQRIDAARHDIAQATIAAQAAQIERLKSAGQRLIRAFEADSELTPNMDCLTSFETNGAAIGQMRDALAGCTLAASCRSES